MNPRNPFNRFCIHAPRGWTQAASIIALGMIVHWLGLQSAVAQNRPPNIILIVADDLGAMDLGCYGSQFHSTPHLDRMAREGARMTQAYSAGPVCSPTRAALMTGKSPARLHLTDFIPGGNILPDQKLRRPDFRLALPLQEMTLAESLQEAGYRTGFIGKWHLGSKDSPPSSQGFQDVTPDLSGFARKAPFGPGAKGIEELEAAADGEELTSAMTRRAVRFIRENSSRPFFLYFAQVAVHIPLHGREDRVAHFRNRIQSGSQQTNALHAAMLETMDESVGSVMKAVKDAGIDDNTLVVFTSDNGGLHVQEGPNTPATSNHPLRAGKGHLYEGGLRVALLARQPGRIPAGSQPNLPCSSMDLQATLLDWAGVDAPPGDRDGLSFAGSLRGEGTSKAEPLYWHYPHYSNQGGRPGGVVREGDYKLIEFYESGYLELYDLAKDPSETRSLSQEKPEVANRMARMLADYRKRTSAQMPARNTNYVRVAIQPSGPGLIRLPAQDAQVFGEKLQYEPPAHKHTLGYWVNPADWAEWDAQATEPGDYMVEVLQGCGKGSGDSEVEIKAAGQSLRFKVQDTGHFQNFIRREIGVVRLTTERFRVEVRALSKPGVAVMDLRELSFRRKN